MNFTLTTSVGDLDVLGEVIGGGRYEDLVPHTFVTVEKLIELKRAAGRPKDFEAIAELEIIRDKLRAKS